MDYEAFIRNRCVRPVCGIKKIENKILYLIVEYSHGEVKYKIDACFQMFFTVMQHVSFNLTPIPVKACTKESIKYFDLLGFRVGDTAVFNNGTHFSIQFSSRS